MAKKHPKDEVILANWMRSSLPKAWVLRPELLLPNPPSKALTSVRVLRQSSKDVFLPEFRNAMNIMSRGVTEGFDSLKRFYDKKKPVNKAIPANESGTENTGSSANYLPQATQQPIDRHKALILQATQYLVDATKKGQLKITPSELKDTATEIVTFVEGIAIDVYKRAKRASTEMLVFSPDAQAVTAAMQKLPEILTPREDIYQLVQGALRYLDKNKLFPQDPSLYRSCIALLSEVIANGVQGETSLSSGKKKGLSF